MSDARLENPWSTAGLSGLWTQERGLPSRVVTAAANVPIPGIRNEEDGIGLPPLHDEFVVAHDRQLWEGGFW